MNRKIIVLSTIMIIAPVLPASATIINVPDDYLTIQEGINASTDGDTVLVQPGTYIENINFNGHNITLGSLFLTTGDTTYIGQTVIDGDSSGSVVTFESGEDSTAVIAGFVVRNGLSASIGGGISCVYSDPTIASNYIRGNSATGSQITDGTGGGIFCFYSDAIIRHNTISGNVAEGFPTWTYGTGGAIYCYNSSAEISCNLIFENDAQGEWGFGGGVSLFSSSPRIINNVIISNSALHWGGGIHCFESSPIMVNNALSWNSAGVSGGGIYCELVSNPTITNTVFWADSSAYSPEIDFDDSSSPLLRYCDIEGGWGGEGNIDTDPLFRDPENGDFRLKSDSCGYIYDSPCIDAGDPAIIDSIHGCDWGLEELRSDMGAYGGQAVLTNVDEEKGPETPERYLLFQNYPNPFNAATVIRYALPEPAHVKIEIFDILGRKVETPIDEKQQAGYHQIIWNADNFPSGVYFAWLVAGQQSENMKMVLMK